MSRARDLADAGSKANFLDNVTANIPADVQTSLDAKAPKASPTFTGNVGLGSNAVGLFNGQISSNATFPTGHVLQVIRGTTSNSAETFTSATPAGSAIYVDITPKETSSKIYLSASVGIDTIGTNNAWIAFYRKVGSGTFNNIGENGSTYDGHYYINPITGRHLDGASMVYLDSPSYTLTNTIRYALYVGTQGSSCQLRHDLQTPSIIAMEVKV